MNGASAPTGQELVDELRRAAERKGMMIGVFIAPIAGNARSFLHALRNARRPKPDTVERVRALISGQPIPGGLTRGMDFAGGTPGTINNMTSAYSLQRTLQAKARVEARRRLTEQAFIARKPGETLASAVRRVEQEMRP